MENIVDWNWWLDKKTVKDWEACALSLEINPRLILEKINPINPHQTAYLLDSERYTASAETVEKFGKRMDLIKNNKYPEGFNFGRDEVYLDKFVRWAVKTRTFNVDMPANLIKLVDSSLVKPIKKEAISQDSRMLSPKDWNLLAEKYADELLKSNSSIGIDETAKKIVAKFDSENIQSVRGKSFDWETIRRHLSDWGFNRKRNQINTK